MHVDMSRINHLIIYALLLSLLLSISITGTAMAKPELSPVAQVKTTPYSTHSKNATDTASNAKGASNMMAKPDSAPDGKFLIGEYEDPSKTKSQGNFFVQLASTVWDVIKYIFYLALVLGVGFLAIYGIKLFTTKYNTITGGGTELINILEIRYLAPGKAICLVEVAGKVLALGLSGNTINSLSEFTDIEQVDALKKAASKKPEPLQPFQGVLEKFTKRFLSQPQTKTTRAVRQRRENKASSGTDWKDDLYSTGDNIRKLLDDIKEHERKTKDSGPTSKHDRGGEKK